MKTKGVVIGVVVAAIGVGVGGAWTLGSSGSAQSAQYASNAAEKPRAEAESTSGATVEIKPEELDQFKILPVQERTFSIERQAVGSIDFNEEMLMDVFPTVPGKILKLFASAGDDVKQGAPLYTIDSPDLSQAASNLISAAAVLELTTRALKRAKELFEVKGCAERDLEQAVSDQQGAEAALKQARDAVRIFGKTDKEMDVMISVRKIDSELIVPAPIAGRVTARNAAPGVLAQPGNQPAPYTLADVSSMWMVADVAENDFSVLKLGQTIDVSVKSYPGRMFQGKIVNIGAAVDPASRRVTVRSVVSDPQHELRCGMFATFIIKVSETRSLAVPQNGVVREGDGSRTVWVAVDRKTLAQRFVKVGLLTGDYFQILEGLRPGDQVATEAALFLGNILVGTEK